MKSSRKFADNYGPLAQNHFMVLFPAHNPRKVPEVKRNNPFSVNNLRVTKTESKSCRASLAVSN